MKKKTYKEALEQFQQQGRNDILLLEEDYKCWREKAKFLDLIINEVFEAIPKSVFYQKSCHPKRAKEIRKQTNLEKYGNICSLHGTTNEAKEVNKKKIETWKTKYGVDHFSKSKEIRKKVKETNEKRYGVSNPGEMKKLKVSGSSMFVEDWFLQQAEPKPCSYQSFGSIFLFGKGRTEFEKGELEKFLIDYREHKTVLEKLGEEVFGVCHFNQKIDKEIKYRPDFKINQNEYVNVDGLFWHSIKNKDKRYHFEMREVFENKGYRIYQFREDEIRDKREIVSSIIEAKMNKCLKIFARKCSIKVLTQKEATSFLEENHLMGNITAKHIGLVNQENLVAVFSYKIKGETLIIERFSNAKNLVVVGGLSKLISHCTKTNKCTKVQSWVDLRYGTGQSLISLNFRPVKTTLGWKWTDGKNTYNRLHCRANMDQRKLSEKKQAEELGWYKIYDAGQRLFELSL